MIGFAAVALMLTLLAYVALRRSVPTGVPLDPWPIIARYDEWEGFERNLPRPGTTICGAAPPTSLLRQLAAQYDGFVGLTYCHLEPAVTRMHVGIVVTRLGSGPVLFTQHTWIEEPRYYRRRRWTWWRRVLIRLAAS